jgi:hypothetical protein
MVPGCSDIQGFRNTAQGATLLRYTYITYLVGSMLYMLIYICFLSPCHNDMAHLQVAAAAGDPHIWTAAANMLNKQSKTADKGKLSRLGAGRLTKSSSP